MEGKFTDADILKSVENNVNFEKNELGLSPVYGYKTGLSEFYKVNSAKTAKRPNVIGLN